MTPKKKKPNFFRSHSPRINKWFLISLSSLFSVAGVLLAICIAELISDAISEPGMDIASLFMGFDLFTELLLSVLLVVFIVFAAIVIYNYTLNREEYMAKQEATKSESPLQGAAAEHEEEIVTLLKTIAQPLPGKQKLNRAATAQFMRALAELSYIDANLKAQHLLPWIEQVTNLTDGENGHFQAAYNKATALDTNVQEYIRQIQAIVQK